MEVTQFTYFQQVGGIECEPVSGELTYGLERLAMYVRASRTSTTSTSTAAASPTARCSTQAEREYSAYNFEIADTELLFRHFADAEKECAPHPRAQAAAAGLRPVHQGLATSSTCSTRAASISVTERRPISAACATLAKACCEAWLASARGTRPPGTGRCLSCCSSCSREEIPARMQAGRPRICRRLVTAEARARRARASPRRAGLRHAAPARRWWSRAAGRAQRCQRGAARPAGRRAARRSRAS